MTSSHAQLLLEFPRTEDLSRASYMQLESCKLAWQAVQAAARDKGVAGVYGVTGVGKSHLLSAWAEEQSAQYWHADDIPADILPQKAVAVDDVHMANKAAQEKLFFWVNHCMREKIPFVFATEKPVSQLNLMPELASRLLTGSQTEITAPEAGELEVMIVKWAYERQLELDPDVVHYMLARTERSAGHIKHLLHCIDELALREKRRVTKPFVREVLAVTEQGA